MSTHDGGAAAPRYLCLCADDYGMSHGINAAVLDLIDRGRLSATSCLVQRKAWQAGLAALRQVDPHRIDVGLHLDLTPPADPGGAEPGLASLLARSYSRTASRKRLHAAIASQLSRFEDGMGRAPAHVDGHRHVHQFPVVRQLLVNELARRYGGAAPWLRNTAPRAPHGSDGRKARIIHALGGEGLRRAAAWQSIPMSNALLGVYGFEGGASAYRQRLHAWLGVARSGDVLMCHPSAGDAGAMPHDEARRAEYAVLAEVQFPWTSPHGDLIALATLSAHPPRAPHPPHALRRAR